jgi:uncharacterized membrane protein HdeD (DUF308 family)
MEIFTAIAFFTGLVALYFLPAIVAKSRNHNNTAAIFILNIFAGWTIIAWVFALVWAFTDNRKNKAQT